MSNNFYGHNPNLKLPFIFDKTYPNFYEAMQEINLYDEDNNLRDPIYVGRYIFINYDLPPKTGGDNNDIFGGYPKIEWSEEKEEYAEILATGNNASLNNLIDTVAFDSGVDYHLSAWRKIIKYEDDNPKYDYEQIGSFNVTLPQINLINKLIDPEEVIEETIDGEITPPEKGSTNQTYYLTIPIAKPWDIQLGDYDYHQDGFNPEENNYEEELSDFSLEEDLAKNYIRLETDSENPGVKFLKISIPAIGNTIAELFNLMYGKDRDQTNITWDFTYQSAIDRILTQEEIDKGIYYIYREELKEYELAVEYDPEEEYYIRVPKSNVDLDSIGGCINAVQNLLGKEHYYNLSLDEYKNFVTDETASQENPAVNKIALQQKVTDLNKNYVLFNFPVPVYDEDINLINPVLGTFCYVTPDSTTVINGQFTMEQNGSISFDTFVDLILKGHEVLNSASTISNLLDEYGEKITTIDANVTNTMQRLEEARIEFPGLRTDTSEGTLNQGTEIFNIKTNSEGEIETNNLASGSYTTAHGLKTEATGEAQMVIGKYNLRNSDAYFIIGNGTETNRDNLLVVKKDNTLQFNGAGNFEDLSASVSISSNKITCKELLGETIKPTGTLTLKNLSFSQSNPTITAYKNTNTTINPTHGKISLGSEGSRFNQFYVQNITAYGTTKFKKQVCINDESEVDENDSKGGQLILGSLSATGKRMALDENEIAVFDTDGSVRNFYIHAKAFIPSQIKGQQITYLGGNNNRWKKIYTQENVSVSSDLRLKDIQEEKVLNNLLNAYNNFKPITYYWKNDISDDKKLHIGLGAQDVEKSLNDVNLNPEKISLIDTSGEYYALEYGELHGLHIAKNQEQDKKIKELEEKIKILEEKINKLM